MSYQEMEHWDHEAGRASEMQNCFSEAGQSRSLLNDAGAEVIDNLLAQGFFVVVQDTAYYCRATDALAGFYKAVAGHYLTRAEAQEAAERAAELEDRYGDGGRTYVLPELPVAPVAAAPPVHDDLPF